MKHVTFYRVHSTDDPAQSDTLFATKKAREAYIKEMYEPDDEGVIRDEITCASPLTKENVCRLYSMALR